jgi:hypothetical protein
VWQLPDDTWEFHEAGETLIRTPRKKGRERLRVWLLTSARRPGYSRQHFGGRSNSNSKEEYHPAPFLINYSHTS